MSNGVPTTMVLVSASDRHFRSPVRRCFAALGIYLALATAGFADVPFLPPGGVPDYVVTMATQSVLQKEDRSETHIHHDGWTRVEEAGSRMTTYFGHADRVIVRMTRDASGEPVHFDIIRRYKGVPSVDSFKTGEARIVLDVPCEVWNVQRVPGSKQLVWYSCVTSDGIEVARRIESTEEYVLPRKATTITVGDATSIDRRAVSSREVRPPVEALDLKTWNEAAAWSDKQPAGSPADFEAVIESENETVTPDARRTRTVRRHYPWMSIEEKHGDGVRTFNLLNQSNRFSLYVQFDADGRAQSMSINKPSAPQKPEVNNEHGPVDLQSEDKVLGETCKWFDTTPNTTHSRVHECRSTDGILLKERILSYKSTNNYVATRLSRRPVPLVEVLPPGDLLTSRSWDLPE